MKNKIYVIGHKSPDLDTTASAIAYSWFKNKQEKTLCYTPSVAGPLNEETKYVLKKFNFPVPPVLKTLKGKKIILVDHNEVSQSADHREEAEIIEVLDHHKINFKYDKPIVFRVLPWGATATIIAHCCFKNNIKINKKMAGLLLSAILVDTVITKSPTCTLQDKEMIKKLSLISGIKNWKKYGMEIFKIRSNVKKLTPQKIIKSDFKNFNFISGKFGIGQVETTDLNDFSSLEEKIITQLNKIREKEKYHSVILFITDILKEGSLFLVSTQDKKNLEKALGKTLDNNKAYIPKIISRKKQVVPFLTKIFN